jgi:hypothetical protein
MKGQKDEIDNSEACNCTSCVACGQVAITPAASKVIDMDDISSAMQRHRSGDWGCLCPVDCQTNEDALKNGGRLLSRYRSRDGIVFWIITEADRSATTLMLPSDY